MPQLRMVDRLEIDDGAQVRYTSDGYLVAQPKVARTGIQIYGGREVGKPEMDTVRVYRPESEVFKADSLRSYAHRPMTNDHPAELVTSDNWRKYAVGSTGDEIIRDGTAVRVPMTLMDAAAIKAYKDGKKELSLGYLCDLKWEPGKTDDGQEYDAIQTNIVANHLALVTAARGGPELRIGDASEEEIEAEIAELTKKLRQLSGPGAERLREKIRKLREQLEDSNEGVVAMADKTLMVDGVSITVPEMAAQIVQRFMDSAATSIKALQTQFDAFKEKAEEEEKKMKDALTKAQGEVATKDAEIAVLRKQVADAEMSPEKIDAIVRDRADVIGKARAMLGDKLTVDAKTSTDAIRKQLVDTELGDAAKNYTADQYAVAFNALTAKVKAADAPNGASVINQHFQQPPQHLADARETAFVDYNKGLTEAWKTPQPQQ